jgi:transcriptional regulator GlxA family with amidase domain
MRRPHFLGALAAAPLGFAASASAAPSVDPRAKLVPGQRLVAFAVTNDSAVIDFAGPWEAFQDVPLPGHGHGDAFVPAFVPLMVGDATTEVNAGAGMRVCPNVTFENAPRAEIVVVGAQRGSPALKSWLVQQAKSAEVVMSVCTGAFKLAAAGLLDGRPATTHHAYYDEFAKLFPKVKLIRGPRFVDDGNICSAGGLSSGIDLALHVIERYHGAQTAAQTAAWLEFVPTARPVG